MNFGALLFKQQIPIVVELEGDVDGQIFSVRGKGYGESSIGKLEIDFVSTTGELPVAWASLVSSLAYGMLCFTKYPNDIEDFFKSCMPEGFVQERTISYEGDGVYKTRAEVTFENGSVYNRVKLNGEGFKKDGNILGKKLDFSSRPSSMIVFAENAALRSKFHSVHDLVGGGVQIAVVDQRNLSLSDGNIVKVPKYHHIKSTATLTKDHTAKCDNLKLVEFHTAVDPSN